MEGSIVLDGVPFHVSRRDFLKSAGVATGARHLQSEDPADYTLTIATKPVELAPNRIVSVTIYNGQFPGPLLRLKVHEGKRYRIRMRNASDDIHPIHLHRHSFELTRVTGQPTSGVIKDVVTIGGYQEAEIDFVEDNPGLTLFHCHQQLHMDFGFMSLFDYV